MKGLHSLVLILLSVSFFFLGCGQSHYPFDAAGDNSKITALPVSLSAAQGPIILTDDFQSGIDPGKWFLELVNGAQWTHMTEGSNGYIHAPTQYPNNYNNRCTDILSHIDDFEDFTLSWDMRFLNQGFHKDRRLIYFRCDNHLVSPHGYRIHIAVGYPYGPDHWLYIQKHNMDGSGESLTPQILPDWQLNVWFSFKLEVQGSVFKLKYWVKGDPEPEEWIVEAEDPAASFASGRIGFGNYLQCNTDVDNVMIRSLVETVKLDIKPGSCPNPMNVQLFDPDPPKN